MSNSISFPTSSLGIGEVPSDSRPYTPALTLLTPEYTNNKDIRRELENAVFSLNHASFDLAGLNGRSQMKYGSSYELSTKAEDWKLRLGLSRSAAAYILWVMGKEEEHAVGIVEFLDPEPDTTIVQSIMPRKNATRQLNGWFNASRLPVATPEFAKRFAVTSLRTSFELAAASGIKNIELPVTLEDTGKDKNLIVLQHSIDPSEHGFSRRPLTKKEKKERKRTDNIWTRDIAGAKQPLLEGLLSKISLK